MTKQHQFEVEHLRPILLFEVHRLCVDYGVINYGITILLTKSMFLGVLLLLVQEQAISTSV
jgi:hypothetical protein